MRAFALAGAAGLVSLALAAAPAQASVVLEQWSAGPFTAQIAVRAGDANGDGKADLVGVNTTGYGSYVKLSTGSAFQNQVNWGAGGIQQVEWYDHFVADADGDGRADLLEVGPNFGPYMAKSKTDIYGTDWFWTPTTWVSAVMQGQDRSLAADMNGDGLTDIIGLFYARIQVSLSTPTGGQQPVTWAAWVRGENATLAADANGDDKADLVLVDDTGVRVIVTGTNRWYDTPAQWTTRPFSGTKKTLTADIDGDGDADLIAVNDTDVQVMHSTGTTYTAPETWYTGAFAGTKETLTADVDGDGDADLVAVNDNDVWVLRTQ
ncbi:VCBS repeat-containing protein [Amycolatopsis acidicola]|uniref:VCBS repeat-containing protein n=1 Tax=Amycolatopsis acidicola TaxID=2596893 RepID=A0A5N0UZV3_9PSEU|nr:VCBS repeat-containing protein [Amycolatopsis acidicola]KAA9156973.1 VCBS repeat-containing protein [Amycolatopsis acidicola]